MTTSRELQWEELDLLQGLEVVPVENDNGGIECHVDQLNLTLQLTLWPCLGVVDITLVERSSQAVLLDFMVAVRGRIYYNNDKRGQYLTFPNCVLVSRSASFSEQNESPFSPNVVGRPMLVAIRPRLSVLFN
ncbi:hypothetical protein [Hymenobacter sp.]|jgi:hypothetical protein|uniref:hypothetical protein n=1 Tax=Hymenobacter sp. TaxID=1898978 RepID=UPI002EDBA60D